MRSSIACTDQSHLMNRGSGLGWTLTTLGTVIAENEQMDSQENVGIFSDESDPYYRQTLYP